MLPRMTSYTPSLYQPNSYGRYRHYPHTVETPIPGAGYHVGSLFWGEQELNLDGSTRPQPHGSYSLVPLRGLGLMMMPSGVDIRKAQKVLQARQEGGATWETAEPEDHGFVNDVQQDFRRSADEIAAAQEAVDRAQREAAAAAASAAVEPEPPSFFMRKAGPLPYWAIGLLGLGVVGAGGFLLWGGR